MKVKFLDLKFQHDEINKDLESVIKKVIRRGDFILGEEVKLFESEFASYCSRKFAIGVNSGTDALFLGLLGLGIGSGDEVIVPAFTYIATALAVSFTGARPVFVDIDVATYNIDINKIEQAITQKTRAIIPVHLYGHPADMKPILEIADRYNLKVIEDVAQAHGAKYKISEDGWKVVGSFGDIGCFSFYPTKNLGAIGDGGMIVTDNEDVYQKLIMLRDYGRKSRYEHVALGYNSRLDTLQAGILRIKLKNLNRWNELRRRIAKEYTKLLKDIDGVVTPEVAAYGEHVYHIYALRTERRDSIIDELTKEGIGVLIHYPIPLHLQKVYEGLEYKRGDFPISEKVSEEVLSLPMYPGLKENQIELICNTLKDIVER